MLKKVIAAITALLTLFSVSVLAVPSSWAEGEIQEAVSANIVPKRILADYQSPINREEFCEMVMLLWRELAGKEAPVSTSLFSDTQNPAVASAAELGIVKGVGDGLFAPTNAITRQEICVMLKNALASACPTIAFPDTYVNTFPDMEEIADWALPAVQCMNAYAVILGNEGNAITPLGNTTREQAILLAYRLLKTQRLTMLAFIEKYMMIPSGNTHENMLNGGFCVGMGQDHAYFSDKTGIWSNSQGVKTVVTDEEAKNMVAFSDVVYYIGADDCIYIKNFENGEEKKLIDTKTDCFSAYIGAIFYRNLLDGGKIYKYTLETKETSVLTENAAELPVIDGKGIFITDGTSVYKLENDGTKTLIADVSATRLSFKNDYFYYLNAEGKLCSMNEKGENQKVLSDMPVSMFCLMRDAIIVQGGADNAVYKLDYNGKYLIRIDTGNYEKLNAYDDFVYGMDNTGVIYKFKIDATEKQRIN